MLLILREKERIRIGKKPRNFDFNFDLSVSSRLCSKLFMEDEKGSGKIDKTQKIEISSKTKQEKSKLLRCQQTMH